LQKLEKQILISKLSLPVFHCNWFIKKSFLFKTIVNDTRTTGLLAFIKKFFCKFFSFVAARFRNFSIDSKSSNEKKKIWAASATHFTHNVRRLFSLCAILQKSLFSSFSVCHSLNTSSEENLSNFKTIFRKIYSSLSVREIKFYER